MHGLHAKWTSRLRLDFEAWLIRWEFVANGWVQHGHAIGVLFPWVQGGVGCWHQRSLSLAGGMWHPVRYMCDQQGWCLLCMRWVSGTYVIQNWVSCSFSRWWRPSATWHRAKPSKGESEGSSTVKLLSGFQFWCGWRWLCFTKRIGRTDSSTHSSWVKLCQLSLLSWSSKLLKVIMWIWLKCSGGKVLMSFGREWRGLKC